MENKFYFISILILSSSLLGVMGLEISQERNNSFTEMLDINFELEYPEIAFVHNSFNGAAYSGFYSAFVKTSYGDYNEPKLSAASYFIRNPKYTWSTSNPTTFISKIIAEGYPADKINYINDEDVHFDNLYDINGKPKYSTIIYVHNEYVTMDQYLNTIKFIKSGGNVIVLNGNAFFAEVDYREDTNKVYLVSGHSWDFDGENGTTSGNYYRFYRYGVSTEHRNMFGSRYCMFNKGSFSGAYMNSTKPNSHPIATKMDEDGYSVVGKNIGSHEENCVITPNYHEIADWRGTYNQPNRGVKVYEFLPFGPVGGSLIHLGLYSTDFIGYRADVRKLIVETIKHQANYFDNIPWIRYPMDGAVLKDNVILDIRGSDDIEIYLDGIYHQDLTSGSSLDFLDEGTHSLRVIFQNTIREVKFTIDRTQPVFSFTYNNSLPLNDSRRAIPIRANVTDDNIESIYWMQYKDIRNIVKTKTITADGISTNPSYIDINIDNADHNFAIKIIAVDSAGNSATNYFVVNDNTTLPAIIQDQPKLIRNSQDEIKIIIPKNQNVLSILQISNDFGEPWQNYKFNNYTDTELIATYSRNEDRLWYRVALRFNNSVDYIHSIRSYQWDLKCA